MATPVSSYLKITFFSMYKLKANIKNSDIITTIILFQIFNGYITYVRISTAKNDTPGDKQLEETNRNMNEKARICSDIQTK